MTRSSLVELEYYLGDESQLGDPVGEPAEDVDSDDGQHKLGHLPMGLPLTLRPFLTTWPH